MLTAVRAVLERRGRPMGVTEIIHATEQMLRRPISGSSVRNCLVGHIDGEGALFERVSR